MIPREKLDAIEAAAKAATRQAVDDACRNPDGTIHIASRRYYDTKHGRLHDLAALLDPETVLDLVRAAREAETLRATNAELRAEVEALKLNLRVTDAHLMQARASLDRARAEGWTKGRAAAATVLQEQHDHLASIDRTDYGQAAFESLGVLLRKVRELRAPASAPAESGAGPVAWDKKIKDAIANIRTKLEDTSGDPPKVTHCELYWYLEAIEAGQPEPARPAEGEAKTLERAAEILDREQIWPAADHVRDASEKLRASPAPPPQDAPGTEGDVFETVAREWLSDQPWVPDDDTQKFPDDQARTLAALLRERFGPLVEALEKIERWFGEFPEAEFRGEPCSYGSAYGSNGERDYMRAVAREAVARLRAAGKGGK